MTWGPLTSTNSDLYFSELNNMTKLEAVQGEGHGAYLAAQHISKWHNLSEDQDWRTPARVVLYSCLLNWVEIKWTDTDTVFSVDIFWYISKLYVYCEWMNIECCHVPFLNGAITWFSYICRYGCLPTAISTVLAINSLSSSILYGSATASGLGHSQPTNGAWPILTLGSPGHTQHGCSISSTMYALPASVLHPANMCWIVSVACTCCITILTSSSLPQGVFYVVILPSPPSSLGRWLSQALLVVSSLKA